MGETIGFFLLWIVDQYKQSLVVNKYCMIRLNREA